MNGSLRPDAATRGWDSRAMSPSGDDPYMNGPRTPDPTVTRGHNSTALASGAAGGYTTGSITTYEQPSFTDLEHPKSGQSGNPWVVVSDLQRW